MENHFEIYFKPHKTLYRIKEVRDINRNLIENKLEVDTFNNYSNSYYVIGTIEYVPKEEWCEFKSCGLRYLEHSTVELNQWILKVAELYAHMKKFGQN